MKSLFLVGFMMTILLLGASVSQAGLLHQNIAYWYRQDGELRTEFNPTKEWLDNIIPTGQAIMSVQQIIYDEVSTSSILRRNGNGTSHMGFLYAYSITNLNAGEIDGVDDTGIKTFAANWACSPVFVTVSRQNVANWVVDTTVPSTPAWKWIGSGDSGISPGETVGGFWAISNVSTTCESGASAVCVSKTGQEILVGRTLGPVSAPDPASFATLATGLVGLAFMRRLRVK